MVFQCLFESVCEPVWARSQNVSIMANYESAKNSLLQLSIDCEEKMEKKIELLALRVEKLAALRKDTTEDRVLLVGIMEDHRKYITMLEEELEETIRNYLPVVARMDQRVYDNGSWKVSDKYACDCKDFNYEHGCKGKGHFGSYKQIYVFMPKSWKTKNVKPIF